MAKLVADLQRSIGFYLHAFGMREYGHVAFCVDDLEVLKREGHYM